jgi:hypothetical protein
VEIRSERRFARPVPPDVLWGVLGRVDAYRQWWPWLQRFEADALAVGERWTCEVHPPVPYQLAFTITLDEVAPAERVRATVSGDVIGSASVLIEPAPAGSSLIRFSSSLAPGNGFLRAVATMARPVAQFGHDWVLDMGGRQFRERALAPEPA